MQHAKTKQIETTQEKPLMKVIFNSLKQVLIPKAPEPTDKVLQDLQELYQQVRTADKDEVVIILQTLQHLRCQYAWKLRHSVIRRQIRVCKKACLARALEINEELLHDAKKFQQALVYIDKSIRF